MSSRPGLVDGEKARARSLLEAEPERDAPRNRRRRGANSDIGPPHPPVPGDAYAWVLYVCVALFGAMIIPTYSLALAHLSDAVEQEEMVAASGGLLLAHGAGAAAGPLIAGFAMSATPRGLPYTLVAAQVLIVLFGVRRLVSRAAPPVTHKSAFMLEPPVPVGTEFAAAHSTPA